MFVKCESRRMNLGGAWRSDHACPWKLITQRQWFSAEDKRDKRSAADHQSKPEVGTCIAREWCPRLTHGDGACLRMFVQIKHMIRLLIGIVVSGSRGLRLTVSS